MNHQRTFTSLVFASLYTMPEFNRYYQGTVGYLPPTHASQPEADRIEHMQKAEAKRARKAEKRKKERPV